MCTSLRRSLLPSLLLACAATLAAAMPAAAAGYEGSYDVLNQTLTVQAKIGLKLGLRSESVQVARKFDIRSGQLPPNAFAKEKDVWTNKIISWRLFPKQREIVAIAAVRRAYDDLLTRLNQKLRCFPDRMTLNQAGVFSADLELEDVECSRTSTLRVDYDAGRGTFRRTRLNPVDLAFQPGWLLLGGSTGKLSGSFAEGQMKWEVQATLLGTSFGGGALTVNLGLQGTSALARVPQ